MVTHSAEVAGGASRVVRMRDGRVLHDIDNGGAGGAALGAVMSAVSEQAVPEDAAS